MMSLKSQVSKLTGKIKAFSLHIAKNCKKMILAADRTSIIGLFPNWMCLVFTFDDPDI